VLERLAARYRDNTSLWGIEVLNEPVSPEIWELVDVPRRYPAADPAYAEGSEPVPTAFLKSFYQEAYARIRAQSDSVRIVFHDGFRINEWIGFFNEPDFRNIMVDTHMYAMMYAFTKPNASLDDYVAHIEQAFGGTLKAMAEHFPILVGEWCLDTASPAAASLVGDERHEYYRKIADAHLAAWEHAGAWCYWSYKLLIDAPERDVWDMGKVMEMGLLPQ
jgi:glucan 1,3-beta-glucosidase